MDFLNRYRNLSVLLVAILAQVLLLAYQAKNKQDVRLIRIWAVGAVTPLARVLEAGRSGTSGFFHNYFELIGVQKENRDLKAERDRLQMENQYLRDQLETADNAKALSIFIPTSRSKTLAARNIGRTTDSSAQVIMVDRGSSDGVQKGMAVRTPEGIVGKVIDVFSKVSDVLLITDPSFAASVVGQKHHARGTLRVRDGSVVIDYVQNEEMVEPGEWFFTSGDDLIFPKGIQVGQVTMVHDGRAHKEIHLAPSGLQNGLDDVLILIDGVHGTIPPVPAPEEPVHLLPPPPPDDAAAEAEVPAQSGVHQTDLDRLVEKDRALGQAQGHVFGDKNSPAPNYNLAPPGNLVPGNLAPPEKSGDPAPQHQ